MTRLDDQQDHREPGLAEAEGYKEEFRQLCATWDWSK